MMRLASPQPLALFKCPYDGFQVQGDREEVEDAAALHLHRTVAGLKWYEAEEWAAQGTVDLAVRLGPDPVREEAAGRLETR